MALMNGGAGRGTVKDVVDKWLLNTGAVLGALCLLFAAMTFVFGLKPLIFSSGSMGPAIPTGSLALAVPVSASAISPGEVVSVVSADGTRVTHRVVSVDPADGLVLKGDANAVADVQPFTGPTVDRVFFSVPGLGYVLSWMASPWVFLLGGLLSAYLIYGAFFRPDADRQRGRAVADKPGTRRRTWLGIGAIAVVIAVAVPLGAVAKVESTLAAWTANATASSNVAALQLNAASNLKCAASGSGNQAINVTWTAANNPQLDMAGYRVSVTVKGESNSDDVAGTSKVMALNEGGGGLLGGVLNLLGGVLQLLLGGAQPVDVRVVAVHQSGWVSAPISVNGIATISQPLLPLLGPPIIKCK